MTAESFRVYLKDIRKNLEAGDATEHTHRPALKTFIESLAPKIVATNEPSHTKVGAPDFNVKRDKLLIGHIECKDVGVDLMAVLKTDQLKRYLANLPNLILTDYINFIWFRNEKEVDRAHIAKFDSKGNLKLDTEALPRLEQLFENFLKVEPEKIADPRKLAVEMARPARMIRNTIREIFKQEAEEGPLHAQLAAFKKVLLPELDPNDFADMYAQTIAYGLFTALTDPDLDVPQDRFDRHSAAHHLPKTNPFLRWLFAEIMSPSNEEDRIIEWVDQLVALLSRCDINAVVESFGKLTKREDPVVHFYETFLGEYDPAMKQARGVYYTPESVVSFIVDSINYLLDKKFKKKPGLADKSVYILDPACGTASFLLEVVKNIHESVCKKGSNAGWSDYVRRYLLPRLFGFELLVAPYTIAHLKLGLYLHSKTDYTFKEKERLGIYLTNTLEPEVPEIKDVLKLPFARPIAKEGEEAQSIKQEKPIMVVLGNPPYKGHSANKGEWIEGLIRDYYFVDGEPLGERNPKYLLDDYVKFLRFAQWRIEQTGHGIVGMITNHGYLDNPTFRGMRQQLMKAYSEIYVLDLHGNSKKKEVCPDGSKDENVFDIQQGVAIGLFIRKDGKKGLAKVHHADLWGLREGKYKYLAEADVKTVEWEAIEPTSPFYLFIPQDTSLKPEYDQGWKITDIMPLNSTGVKTHRDHFVMDFELSSLIKRIEDFRNLSISDEEIAQTYKLTDTRDWKLHERRESLSKNTDWRDYFTQCLYRPFDLRAYYHHEDVVELPREEVMRHMLTGKNLGLGTTRSIEIERGWEHVFCTSNVIQHHTVSLKEVNYLFTLYLYPKSDEQNGRTPNLSAAFIEVLCKKLGIEFNHSSQPLPKGNTNLFAPQLPSGLTPEDVFYYIYAVLHSPTYRLRYADFLKMDFPRIPLTSDLKLFKALAAKGKELVKLHIMESDKLNPVRSNVRLEPHKELQNEVVKVSYDDRHKRVYINKFQYFEKVESAVWEFHVGGYQVCEKWLKDRKGRKLNYDDITLYQKIVLALRETIKLMESIDKAITAWPIQ
jgi:hypothetical protein